MAKQGLSGEAFGTLDDALAAIADTSTFDVKLNESQRQIVLLALQKLRIERPGWDYALSEIEQQLGGQIAWPEYSDETPGAADLLRLIYADAHAAAARLVTDGLPAAEREDLLSVLVAAASMVAWAKNGESGPDIVRRLQRDLRGTTARWGDPAADSLGNNGAE